MLNEIIIGGITGFGIIFLIYIVAIFFKLFSKKNHPNLIWNAKTILNTNLWKKILIILLLVLFIFALFYYLVFFLPNKQKAELDLKNKVLCSKYIPEISDNISKGNNGGQNETFNILEKVFYSPKENTCLYSIKTYTYNDDIRYSVEDLLTNEQVIEFSGPSAREDYKNFLSNRIQ